MPCALDRLLRAADLSGRSPPLFILDDAGELGAGKGLGWEIFRAASRYPTLPAK